ncbi:MAG: ATP-binding cassette domain-containing protein, partial [Methanosarcinales archaeon]|nr:ATP-binding cassette domain-containing protein [Methanosarcinales archaeon]
MSLKVDIVKNLFNDKRGSKKKNVSPNFSLQCRFDAGNEIIVLFGRSGSGKTTALQCISGLDKPDSGNISLNGRTFFDDTSKFNLQTQKRRVGYVFQNITLFPHMDVKQNIAFALKGLTQNEKEARIHEVMELIQIQELELYYPSQLSGGQKQRVVL